MADEPSVTINSAHDERRVLIIDELALRAAIDKAPIAARRSAQAALRSLLLFSALISSSTSRSKERKP